ncbi:MAG TPA: hypothetical protein G4O02_08690 [Caldilineae bacterium]|nr:hypothetical protein [Caldilineae bacterium]
MSGSSIIVAVNALLTFRGDIIVDASGWRAALGGQIRPDLVRRDRLNFGMETTVAYRDQGLHFSYDPRGLLPMGITWAFPIGEFSRIGIGSYRGDTRLGRRLDRFLVDLELRRDGVHGGYFPHALRDPLVGDLFLVGDAAGQCLGLTGESIRPALFFGTHLGRLLRRALEGKISLTAAREAYRRLVAARKPGYDLLCLAQRVLPRLPLSLVQGVMALINKPAVLRRVLALYVRAFWLAVEDVRTATQGGSLIPAPIAAMNQGEESPAKDDVSAEERLRVSH